jgi:hypothetical protein
MFVTRGFVMDKKSTTTTKETKRNKPNVEGTSKMRPRNGGASKTGSTQYHSGQQHHRHSSDTATMEREERKENRNQSSNEFDDEENDEQ